MSRGSLRAWAGRETPQASREKQETITDDETTMASVVRAEQSLQKAEEIINYNLEFYTVENMLVGRIK